MGLAEWGRNMEMGEEKGIVVCHLKSGNEIPVLLKAFGRQHRLTVKLISSHDHSVDVNFPSPTFLP